MVDEEVEAVAKAIYEGRNGRGAIPWRLQHKVHKDAYRADAQAAIRALDAEREKTLPQSDKMG